MYASWSQVAEAVEGEDRLKKLNPGLKNETADAHPFFGKQMALVDQIIDASVAEGGYETPLDIPLADARLQNAAIGIFVGEVTRSKSSREAWMDNMEKAGYAFLKAIAGGDLVLVGAEVDVEVDATDRGMIAISDAEPGIFDIGDPSASINSVLPPIGRSPWGRRW